MPKRKKEKIIFQRKKSPKFSQWNLLFAFFLFFLGLGLFGAFLFSVGRQGPDSQPALVHLIASVSAQKGPIRLDPDFSYTESSLKNHPPVRLLIPLLKIDVPVVQAQIINGYWETATDSASFGLGSAYPEDNGNMVIFAHAREDLFGGLNNTKLGDSIYIFTQNHWYPYRVEEIKTVLPDQVEVVSPTQDKRLTLYTCTGYRDLYRLVVIARPISL